MSYLGLFYFIFVIISMFTAIYNESRKSAASRRAEILSIQEERRLDALDHVSGFLSPFTDIWKDLKISNKFCSLKLSEDGSMIIGKEKSSSNKKYYNMFVITRSKGVLLGELWDSFCMTFGHNSTYSDLVRLAKLCNAKITETKKRNPNYNINNKYAEKTDINNCSEAEMTALPGISIVLSKKAIKKREEIGGFKSIEDFFIYLKIKPHFQEQLQDLICLNKIKGSVKKTLNKERTLDL